MQKDAQREDVFSAMKEQEEPAWEKEYTASGRTAEGRERAEATLRGPEAHRGGLPLPHRGRLKVKDTLRGEEAVKYQLTDHRRAKLASAWTGVWGEGRTEHNQRSQRQQRGRVRTE